MDMNNKAKNNKIINFPMYIHGKDEEHRMIFTQLMDKVVKRARHIVDQYDKNKDLFQNKDFFTKEEMFILNNEIKLIKDTLSMIDNDKINSSSQEDREMLEGSLHLAIEEWDVTILKANKRLNEKRVKEIEEEKKELNKEPVNEELSSLISEDE